MDEKLFLKYGLLIKCNISTTGTILWPLISERKHNYVLLGYEYIIGRWEGRDVRDHVLGWMEYHRTDEVGYYYLFCIK